MNNNKKGFTLIELLSILIVLITIVTIATVNLMPVFDEGKKKSLVDEAFVISEGAINKYSDDRLSKTYTSDLFASKNNTKRCYSLDALFGRYVSKDSKRYHGSIEICTGTSCTYKTKLWLTDGEYYLNGVTVDANLSIEEIDKTATTEYLDSCGTDISNIEYIYLFDYVGYEETFTAPMDGTYSLESWGAQGGDAFYIVRDSFGFGSSPYYLNGGKGGYAYTEIELKKGETLFVTVGGRGPFNTYDRNVIIDGGFNGGGKANYHSGGGGGATHIALKSGPIDTLSIADIVEVAGGGGAAFGNGGEYGQWRAASHGGGNCDAAKRLCFGSGQYGKSDGLGGGGGLYTSGGGNLHYTFYSYTWGGVTYYYNDGAGIYDAATGGVGYIGNPLTKNGIMYCLNTNNTNGSDFYRTVATGQSSEQPIATYGKQGDGFARITYLGKAGKNKYFEYTGAEQTYTVPQTATYKLEVWGAQGGGSSTGGYASGEIDLVKDEVLYINVGGAGSVGTFSASPRTGGYNGGGNGGRASSDWGGGPSGGGATSIATTSGLLSELSGNINSILIVAGGGGGDFGGLGIDDAAGGPGGGFKGVKGYASTSAGGTQTSGYAFGLGAPGKNGYYGNGGSGGGFYGGYTTQDPDGERSGGSGGSGYIGNSRLTNKGMYCNRCEESNETNTKTTATYCIDNNPRSNCAKTGDGYARITLIEN